jgi:sirohydrochlorin ferrochelatase
MKTALLKTALLVMVHGSPKPEANDAMFRVVDLVKERGAFDIVAVGFLECNEPVIPDAIDSCVAQGAERIVAVPYFLHTGAHVAEDLPTLLEAGQARHPRVAFALGRYIGASPRIADALRDRIREATAIPVSPCKKD